MNFNVPALIATLLMMANLAYAAELPGVGVQQEKHFQDQNYLFFLPQGYEKYGQRCCILIVRQQ